MDLVKADLHMHSKVSDGTLTPEELAILLNDLLLVYASLTDHDSLAGVVRVMEVLSRIKSRVKLIPGVEITTHYQQKTLHLLAYGINPNNTELADFLTRQKVARRERAVEIIERLNRMLKNEGLRSIPLEDILALEGEGPITRPDIARYLMQNGYVQNFQEAFDRWLKQCDVPLQTSDVHNTTRFVREIGGTPVIAHAFAPWVSLNTVTRDMTERVRLLMELKASGLQGIEAYYQGYEIDGDEKGLPQNIALTDSLGLLVTGGSDFHGIGPTKEPGLLLPRWRMEKFLESLTR